MVIILCTIRESTLFEETKFHCCCVVLIMVMIFVVAATAIVAVVLALLLLLLSIHFIFSATITILNG